MSRWVSGKCRRMGAALSDQGGAIMVVALLIAAVLLAGVGSAASLASGSNRAVPFWRDRNQAFYIAESGLNHCIWKLKNSGGSIVEATYPVDPPSFTSDSTETAGLLAAGDSYQVWVKTDPANALYRDVAVVGRSRGQSHLLKCKLVQLTPPPFYNPESTTGVITSTPTNITVTGPNLPNLGVLDVPAGETYHLGPGQFLYSSIILRNSARLVLDGDTTLWVTTSIDLKEGSIANPNPDKYNLVIFMPPNTATTQTIVVRNGAVLNAFVYAPDASADLKNNSTVSGSLIVASYSLHGEAYYSPSGEGIPWPSTATIDYGLLPDGYGE